MNKERENIEFFTASDFNDVWFMEINLQKAAVIANRKLNQALGPKIYGSHLELHGGGKSWRFCEEREFYPEHTHEAFLFNVREIVKECEHEPIHVVIALSTEQTIEVKEDAIKLVCSKCNKKLTAKWTVADE